MEHPLLPSVNPDGHSDERQSLIEKPCIEESSSSRSWIGRIPIVPGSMLLLAIALYSILRSPVSFPLIGCRNQPLLPGMAPCHQSPCFEPSTIRVPLQQYPGFPSFLQYAHRGPILVGYDKRSLTLNGQKALFLGGSMHPARATQTTWELALDRAVENGLNLITIYVMWSDHQPLPDAAINWTFSEWSSFPTQNPNWNLAVAIRMAANHGLFVHLRIGPYDCAEYSYGGIPEWLLLQKPGMQLRRPNQEWLETMESFVAQMVGYISDNELWAHQGGPVIIAQIENELGSGDETGGTTGNNHETDTWLHVDRNGRFVVDDGVRAATLQDYADWCGAIAQKYAPNVTWTMCNGLSANNTIHTCNAIDNGASWLESHGGNGRIQVDQPALLTEFEEGFQDWGETPEKPNDYFWGKTASSSTKEALRWFARGGTHLNYYMFWGAYNRGRQAAGGITNWYATDAALCSSGQRHEPKFSHYRSLHQAIASISSVLLTAETALGKAKPVQIWDDDSQTWVIGNKQRMFDYIVEHDDPDSAKRVSFVENDDDHKVRVRIPMVGDPVHYRNFTVAQWSAILIVDGNLEFDAATINPKATSFRREYAHDVPELVGWASWPEPIGAPVTDPTTRIETAPIEQTRLNIDAGVWSDYAWYETFLTIEKDEFRDGTRLYIESQRSNALLVFIDDSFVGAAENHSHIYEGNWTLTLPIGPLGKGGHKLSILSESLGYSNLVGRFGNSGTGPKHKGITGQVILSSGWNATNTSLVDGTREWRSFPGLHRYHDESLRQSDAVESVEKSMPTWYSVLFQSPVFDPSFQSLFLQITVGRGHIWLNGRDLGRYWNITQGETSKHSQEYYFLPIDYLATDGELNEIVIFDATGGSSLELQTSAKLVVSWIAPSDAPNFKDEVNYPFACI